jgi:hypothetical protein
MPEDLNAQQHRFEQPQVLALTVFVEGTEWGGQQEMCIQMAV